MYNCFGCNLDTPGFQGHTGEDFYDARAGDPVYSVSEGIVVYSGLAPGGWGNVIIIQHRINGGSIFSQYAHLQDRYAAVGQVVGRRQQIGIVGQTGTFEPHLHFEIKDLPIIGHGYTGYGFSGIVTVSAWGVNYFLPSWYIENHRSNFYLIADASNPTGVYFVEGNTKRAVPPGVYNSWGFARYPIDYIDHQSFAGFTTGADLTKLISAGGSVYYVDRGEKKWITDPNLFNIWGFDWNSITPVLPATLNSLHTGPNLSLLVQPEGTGSVYLVDNDTRHPLTGADLLQHFGYPALRDVSVISGDFPLSDAAPSRASPSKAQARRSTSWTTGASMLIPSDNVLNLWNLGGASFAQPFRLHHQQPLLRLGPLRPGSDLRQRRRSICSRRAPNVPSSTTIPSATGVLIRGPSLGWAPRSRRVSDGAPLTRLMQSLRPTYLVKTEPAPADQLRQP